MKLYGKYIISKWNTINNDYILRLREDLYSEVKRVFRTKERSPLNRVGILYDSMLKKEYILSVEKFFKELNVKVVNIMEADPMSYLSKRKNISSEFLSTALSRLKDKVDCVILTGTEGVKKFGEQPMKMLKENIPSFPKIIPLPINVNSEPLYLHYTKIGLIFTDNLKEIRRAYLKAFADYPSVC